MANLCLESIGTLVVVMISSSENPLKKGRIGEVQRKESFSYV
jgi:hypothetical protein